MSSQSFKISSPPVFDCDTHGFIGEQAMNIYIPSAGTNPGGTHNYCLYCLADHLTSVLGTPAKRIENECQGP